MTMPNDGGPAFPVITSDMNGAVGQANDSGMSLRDWFAGQVLAATNTENLHYGTQEKPVNPWPWIAADCYRAADAMLAEREEKQ